MKEFFDLFGKISTSKYNVDNIKKGLAAALKGLNKAKEWLSVIGEEKFDNAVGEAGKKMREHMADMVRDGTINLEYLEKVHRLRLTMPSEITRRLEKVINLYYDTYKHEAGTKKKKDKE